MSVEGVTTGLLWQSGGGPGWIRDGTHEDRGGGKVVLTAHVLLVLSFFCYRIG